MSIFSIVDITKFYRNKRRGYIVIGTAIVPHLSTVIKNIVSHFAFKLNNALVHRDKEREAAILIDMLHELCKDDDASLYAYKIGCSVAENATFFATFTPERQYALCLFAGMSAETFFASNKLLECENANIDDALNMYLKADEIKAKNGLDFPTASRYIITLRYRAAEGRERYLREQERLRAARTSMNDVYASTQTTADATPENTKKCPLEIDDGDNAQEQAPKRLSTNDGNLTPVSISK